MYLLCVAAWNATTSSTVSEILEPLGELGLVDVPSSGRCEQKQTKENHEQLPASLSAVLIEFVRFLHGQPHGAAEWTSEEARHSLHNRSSL